MSIPRERYAQMYKSNNDPIEYKGVPVQKPAPDKVLINIKYTGVCHTDLHKDCPLRTKQNLIGGLEVYLSGFLQSAGVVVTIGELVEEIKAGVHAGIKWFNGSCGPANFASQTIAIVDAGGGPGSLGVQYANAMGFRVIAINTGSETQEIFLSTLGAEEFLDFAKGLPLKARISAEVFLTVIEMITIKGPYAGNRLDTQEAIDFVARGLIKVPFKGGKLSEPTQLLQLLKKGKNSGRYVLDPSVSSINRILGRFSDLASLFM
ncbi:hypothetical protein B9Z19DRAFT_1133735 [Tuber borchii]|uniref:Alcohol dehydrogenase-like N-terminal domain-containing protein n=1 Tax=Tuber borchii TaxID=42251 RepID=A0A2T6ZFC8_TUBBO|nr:hypothetical protein B9Z19DRAFT_1133735 [Tuber borchii]